eukprot:scaffold57052_cov15-Tisochrysis_lutea.AAC.1
MVLADWHAEYKRLVKLALMSVFWLCMPVKPNSELVRFCMPDLTKLNVQRRTLFGLFVRPLAAGTHACHNNPATILWGSLDKQSIVMAMLFGLCVLAPAAGAHACHMLTQLPHRGSALTAEAAMPVTCTPSCRIVGMP